MMRLLLLLLQAALWGKAQAFYVPGVNPQSFDEGQQVKLKVNKMTSTKTLLPIDYYNLPFCAPDGGPKLDNENLGEFLAGDRIESSPYYLRMREDTYCEQLCISNLGRGERKGLKPNRVVKAIRKDYHNDWIVDTLSAASKIEDDAYVTTRYWQGFPVGYIADDTHKAYVHNHVNIEIMYHAVETEVDKYRIVRFTVEPFSIKHDFEPKVDDDDAADDGNQDYFLPRKAVIRNPIASCNPNVKYKVHTSYDMVTAKDREPQPASGKVLFTYDVIWKENPDLHWASRWDIYLSMDNAVPGEVHWLNIAISLVFIFILSGAIVAVVVCNSRGYSRLATNEEIGEDLEESGWKAIHADVFRPPSFSPLLLSVCCGTGAQLLCTTLPLDVNLCNSWILESGSSW